MNVVRLRWPSRRAASRGATAIASPPTTPARRRRWQRRPPAHPLGDVRRVDPDLVARLVDAAHDDVNVRVVGVVVVHGAPPQADGEVLLDLTHEVPREPRQVHLVLGRYDEPKLVPFVRQRLRERGTLDYA